MNKQFQQRLRARAEEYRASDASLWMRIQEYFERAIRLFTAAHWQRAVFGPVAEALQAADTDDESGTVRAAITKVAVANAILGALPGKMGVGVLISMGMEVWMGWTIARRVGVSIEHPRDVLRYLGLVGGILFTIVEGFRSVIGFFFSLTGGSMFWAEMLATDLIGVLFWVGFEEVRQHGAFSVPKRLFGAVVRRTKDLFLHQGKLLRGLLNRETLRRVKQRLLQWFKGELVAPVRPLRDDVFVGLAMAAVTRGWEDTLRGPLGQEFVQSIRDLHPDLRDAPLSVIQERLAAYNETQISGELANIKGRLFERLVEQAENTDSDAWIARLHPDRTHPSTDLVLWNTDTGDMYEVSLKATDSPSYIEHTLLRYPDDHILTTDEVARHFAHDPRVDPSGISNEFLTEVTKENFDELVNHLPDLQAQVMWTTVEGIGLAAAFTLWPFVAAYARGRITQAQLQTAFRRLLGQAGVRLVTRLAGAATLGPVYLFYVLARTVFRLFDAAEGMQGIAIE